MSVDAGDRTIHAYAANPAGVEHASLLLVLSEAFGLHEHVADFARRSAHLGYLAVAPNLMARQGDPVLFDDVGTLFRDLLLKIPAQVMRDLDATVTWARANGAAPQRLVATGFCWGGRGPGFTPHIADWTRQVPGMASSEGKLCFPPTHSSSRATHSTSPTN